jgi:hypothetical protein
MESWFKECVACGAIYFGPRCSRACPTCSAKGRDRARGACLECGTAVGPRYLFCAPCRYQRRLDTIHACQRRYTTDHRRGGLPLTPSEVRRILGRAPAVDAGGP